MSGCRARLRRRLAGVALLSLLAPSDARADELDDAFAQGNDAAAAERWNQAIEAYERANAIVPGRAPLLSYNLGTAYAHVGELGHATYHLRRVLESDHGTTPEVIEATRRNLALVRRRLEVESEGTEARLSEPPDWRDAVLAALASGAVGWLAIVSGWAALIVTWARRRLGEISTPVAFSLWGIFALAFIGHAVAIGSDRTRPGAIMVDTVTVRAGPGTHHAREFDLHRGSWVVVDDRRSSWALVRMPSQLAGWVPAESVSELQGSAPPARADGM